MAQDIERLVVQLSADVKKYENALNRAMGQTNRQTRAIERRFSEMNKNISATFADTLRGATAIAGVGFGTREIIEYADAWTQAGNMIRAAATSAGVQTRSLEDLNKGANAARTGLTEYVDLYARLIRSASAVAKSEGEIALATDLVSKAFKAGGASAQEQAAGILQLGQALGSGVLQGDELRSLRENAPVLAKAIADEFKTTVSGLKKLGEDGKLTSERVFRAIINAQKPIEAQFSATNATIADSFTRLRNAFTQYIGMSDSTSGVTGRVNAALNALAGNLALVADAAIVAGGALLVNYAGKSIGGATSAVYSLITAQVLARAASVDNARSALVEAQAAQAAAAANLRYAETALIGARNGTVLGLSVQKASRDMVAAQTAMAAANAAVVRNAAAANAAIVQTGVIATGAAGAMRLLSGALSLVGGPAGAAILAAYAIYQLSSRQTEAEKAAEIHQKSIKELSFQIETLDWANKEVVESTRKKIAADLEAANVALTRAKAERELAASIVKEEINPSMSLLPAPEVTDIQNTIDNSPAVKERQDVIDQLGKQIEELSQKQKDFEDIASGRKKPERNTAGFGGGIPTVPDEDKKKGRTKKTPAERFDSDIQNITDRTASLVAETEAQRQINPLINDYGYAMEKARTEQELLNAAQKAGVAITPELRAQIAATADQWAYASAEAAKLAEAQNRVKESAAEMAAFQKDMVGGIIDGFLHGASAADVFANALGKIADKLIEIGLAGIFDTGGFNPLEWIGLKNGGLVKRASGGIVRGPGGPRGDKIPAMLSDEEFVVNAAATKRNRALLEAINSGETLRLKGGGSPLRAPSMPILRAPAATHQVQGGGIADVRVFVDQDGNWQAAVERISQRNVKSGLQQYDKGGAVRAARDLRQVNSRGYAK